MSIKTNLYSTILHNSVKPRLNELIKQAECLQMSVAYWTISEKYFSSDLVNLLTKGDSFACIDISLPTNVDMVCQIADKTKTVYFHTQSLPKEDKKSPEYDKFMDNHLLHSKILLFDLPNKQASIWIGSHNWTKRALSGINIETSLEILVDRSNRIYREVKDLLVKIKDQCHKVNPKLAEVYKNAQRQEPTFLYLESWLDEKNISSTGLAGNTNNTTVFHLLFNDDNPKIISNMTNISLVLRNSINSNSGSFFEGKIVGKKELQLEPNFFPQLENGYYSFQQKESGFTNFKHIEKLSEKEKQDACYYVTIRTKSPEEIKDIKEFLSKYQAARNIYTEKNTELIWDTENKFNININKLIIDSNSEVVNMSEIEPGQIAKVQKKIKHISQSTS